MVAYYRFIHYSLDNLLWAEKKVRESRKQSRPVTGTEVIDFLGIDSSAHDRKSIASCIRYNVSVVIDSCRIIESIVYTCVYAC